MKKYKGTLLKKTIEVKNKIVKKNLTKNINKYRKKEN